MKLGEVKYCLCNCGALLPPRSGNRLYIIGHSPNGHYGKRKEERKRPLTQQGPKPAQCGKCGSLSIYGDDTREADGGPVTIWCCLNCGKRYY
jgi:DNA-directed RNA polymerase subunit M/transcription elongation factor TFIIS